MPPENLRIGGLVPFSTVDYPGRLSAVVFCQGCPWRCRYCHNTHLQPFSAGTMRWSAVDAFLRRRRGLLDAVVFSGGEPTAHEGLAGAMERSKALGFEIALHTAGIFPRRLKRVLPLADWVALDIKAPLDRSYDTLTGRKRSALRVRASLEAILAAGVSHELRTTIHPLLLDAEAMRAIDAELNALGARPTRRQSFRPLGCSDEELVRFFEV